MDKPLGILLRELNHLHFHKGVLALEKLGLGFGQPPVLMRLWETDGISQKEIAQSMHRTQATLTVTLKRMEASAWIIRRKDEKDSRTIRVFLSEKGKNIRSEVENVLDQIDDEAKKGFSNEEYLLMCSFLQRMSDNLSSPELLAHHRHHPGPRSKINKE